MSGFSDVLPDRALKLLEHVRNQQAANSIQPDARFQDYARAGRGGSGGDDLVTAVVREANSAAAQRGLIRLLPTHAASDATGGGRHPDARAGHTSQIIDEVLLEPERWGKYAPAIARWERVLGRPAPSPTESNRNGNPRLAAAFSEWLMGWPDGWVTDPAIGIKRNDQLRIIGNGVCPQQAAAALLALINVAET